MILEKNNSHLSVTNFFYEKKEVSVYAGSIYDPVYLLVKILINYRFDQKSFLY